MEQLPLWVRVPRVGVTPSLEDPEALAAWLSRRVGKTVHLKVTNNRTTMVSCREEPEALFLRLHRLFARATPEVLGALGDYLAGDRAAGKTVDRFISDGCSTLELEPQNVEPIGRFHDLQQILDELNVTYFHVACQARITWGHAGARRRRRSIQLGSYISQERLIRIHPCLDQAFVPRRYVAWVVYHEMLHEAIGVDSRAGRRSIHPPEFAVLEEAFAGYRECKQWEADNIHRLLRYRPARPSSRRRRKVG